MSGVLSDRSINRVQMREPKPLIHPFDARRVQPSSYDVALDREFRIFDNHLVGLIDPKKPMEKLTKPHRIVPGPINDGNLILHPGEFILGQTVEKFCIPGNIVARIEGKSSLGRIGLLVHATAGFVDPGFEGRLTLELSNQARLPIRLYPGMLIGQISFQWLDMPADVPYNGKYQGDEEPTASLIHQDFEHAETTI